MTVQNSIRLCVLYLLIVFMCMACVSGSFSVSEKDGDKNTAPIQDTHKIDKKSLEHNPAISLKHLELDVQRYFDKKISSTISAVFLSPLSDAKKTEKLQEEKFLSELASTLMQSMSFEVLRLHKPQSMNVIILETDEFNSFVAGYSTLFITRALLDCADTTGKKAALLAHEIAHIALGHALYPVQEQNIENQKALDAQFLSCMTLLMESGYGSIYKNAEFDADKMACALLVAHGYDSSDLIDVLTVLRSRLDYERPDIAKTHPNPAGRIAALKNGLKK